MLKKTLLASAVAAISSMSGITYAQENAGSNPFMDDAKVSGGIYNFTRIRDRKDLNTGDYEENLHHSTAIASIEFNSGLAAGFLGVDFGVFGTYDIWNSGTSQGSEFSLIDDEGKIKNTLSIYKAAFRFDFDKFKAKAGYIQPSGPGVMGVNWSFVPGTYRGLEGRYTDGALEIAYFIADEYKSPWVTKTDEMAREDGSDMKYAHSIGASYQFGNGFNMLGAFGQGEDYLDLYKVKLGYALESMSFGYEFYGMDDKDNTASKNNLFDGLAYQHALTSKWMQGSWTFRGEATYTHSPGSKGAFVFRPTYASGKSNGTLDIWWDNRSDFNHDGEMAAFFGGWYDFSEMGYPGLKSGASIAYGWGAESQDTAITTEELEEIGYSVDLSYTLQGGQYKGSSVALHVTHFDNRTDVGSYTSAFPNAFQDEWDVKLFLSMPLSF